MAKHKLTQLKQSELPMHKYIAKFGEMTKHAYSIKAINSANAILASNFIEGVQNPYIKNKFRSYQVKNLRDIFGDAIQEDQKQKIRALDFGVANPSKTSTKSSCSINAIRDKGCFKCGSKDHFVKDFPLSQPNNSTQTGHYMDHKGAHNGDSSSNKVFEPLSRLFTDLVEQLKSLMPSGHGSHGGTPTYDGTNRNGQQWRGSYHGVRQQCNDNYHKGEGNQQDCHTDCHNKAPFRHNGHQQSNRVGNRSNFLRGHHTRVNEIRFGSEWDSECPVMSDLEEHLEEEVAPVTVSPKKLSYPSGCGICA